MATLRQVRCCYVHAYLQPDRLPANHAAARGSWAARAAATLRGSKHGVVDTASVSTLDSESKECVAVKHSCCVHTGLDRWRCTGLLLATS